MPQVVLHLALDMTVSLALEACSSGERVITIGTAVGETGRYTKEGQHTRVGYLRSEDWVPNGHGSIEVGGDCYMVELVLFDDGGEADTTANLVERLIGEDVVDFLLGPYSSTLTMPAIEVAEARGVILVEGSGATDALFEQSYKSLFAVLTPAGTYADSAQCLLANLVKGLRQPRIREEEVFPARMHLRESEVDAGSFQLTVRGPSPLPYARPSASQQRKLSFHLRNL